MANTVDLHTVLVEKLPQQKSKNYTVYGILGNEFGDESKGKMMPEYLLRKGRKAKFCGRFNGGPNAGHTVYGRPGDMDLFMEENLRLRLHLAGHKTVKFATHQVPTGVLFGIDSFIGYNAVVDLLKLHKELTTVSGQLGQTYNALAQKMCIFEETHVIMPWNVQEDKENDKVGTTGSGMGPTYAAKSRRTGYTIKQYYDQHNDPIFKELTEAILALDPTSFTQNKILGVEIKTLRTNVEKGLRNIVDMLEDGDIVVMEGAQGFLLDINQGLRKTDKGLLKGMYPYVTSSDCTIGAICSYGFELEKLHIVGCSKAYTTYVGALQLEQGFEQNTLHSGLAEMIRLLGKEYGVTTGRRRQCIPFDLDLNIQALRVNQTSDWIVSKSDVLEQYLNILKALKVLCKTRTTKFDPKTPEDNLLVQYMKDTDYAWDLYDQLVARGSYVVIHGEQHIVFDSWNDMKKYISEKVRAIYLPKLKEIVWYDSPASEVVHKPYSSEDWYIQ